MSDSELLMLVVLVTLFALFSAADVGCSVML